MAQALFLQGTGTPAEPHQHRRGEKQGQMLKEERTAGDNPMSRQGHEGHLESPFEIYEF